MPALVLRHLDGVMWLVGAVLYGSGLRLSECLDLRVKDVDFGAHQIVVRSGKGRKDRVTPLPGVVDEPLGRHLEDEVWVPRREPLEQFLGPPVGVPPTGLADHLRHATSSAMRCGQ